MVVHSSLKIAEKLSIAFLIARQQLHLKGHVSNLLERLEGCDYGLARVHKLMVKENLFKGINVIK